MNMEEINIGKNRMLSQIGSNATNIIIVVKKITIRTNTVLRKSIGAYFLSITGFRLAALILQGTHC